MHGRVEERRGAALRSVSPPRLYRASPYWICYENRDGPTSAQPSWPGMSRGLTRPPVVTGSRYGWPAMTMDNMPLAFSPYRGARVRAQ
jgi:hypothetical protein